MLEHVLNLQLVNAFAVAVEGGLGEGMPQLIALPPVVYHSAERVQDRVQLVLSALGPAAQDPQRRFVEVGVYNGNFAYGFVRNSRMKYVGVDPYTLEACSAFKSIEKADKTYDTVSSALREIAGPGREAALWRNSSVEAATLFGEETIDGVFIDGSMYYQDLIEDLSMWWTRLKPGGILFGHQFYQVGGDTLVAVAVFCAEIGVCGRVHLGLDTTYWLQKPMR